MPFDLLDKRTLMSFRVDIDDAELQKEYDFYRRVWGENGQRLPAATLLELAARQRRRAARSVQAAAEDDQPAKRGPGRPRKEAVA